MSSLTNALTEEFIKPGTTLLTCKPFVYAAYLQEGISICDTCLRTSDECQLSQCSSCHMVSFCGESCRKKGLEDGHLWECRGMSVIPFRPTNLQRLLLRAVVKVQDGKDYFDEVDTVKGKVKRRFEDLLSHFDKIQNDDENLALANNICDVATFLLQCVPSVQLPERKELLEICGKLQINSFHIYKDCKLGAALYLGGSICDHSCERMATQSFEGTTLVIRNVREIPKSLKIDQVSLCYIDTLRPSKERRETLKEVYFFECQCERCSIGLYDKEMRSVVCPNEDCCVEIDTKALKNNDTPCHTCGQVLTRDVIRKIKETEKYVVKMRLNSFKVNFEDSNYYQNCLAKLRINHFSETHWLMLSMFYAGFESSYGMKNWKSAYGYGLKYIEGLRRYLHPMNPERGQVLMRMAQISLFLDKRDEAMALVNEARPILEVTLGAESKYFQTQFFTFMQALSVDS